MAVAIARFGAPKALTLLTGLPQKKKLGEGQKRSASHRGGSASVQQREGKRQEDPVFPGPGATPFSLLRTREDHGVAFSFRRPVNGAAMLADQGAGKSATLKIIHGYGRWTRGPNAFMACSFLIITTNNLPEAYFVADFLLQKGQPVAVVNKRGRTREESLRVIRRLARRRGALYLADLLLGRLFRRAFISPDAIPFPEIDDARIQEIIGQVEYHECDDPHAPQTIDWIESYAPDYILIAGAPVLRQDVFSLACCETLNRHQGISPDYRGSDCPIWVLAGDTPEDLGYTIHAVSERVDNGLVFRQKRLSIPDGLDFSGALAYVNRQASIGYTEVLDQIIEGHPIHPKPQSGGAGRYYPPATLSAIRRARNRYLQRTLGGRETGT